MLSRVAESVYWIGRYTERAENTARLLDVSLRSSRELFAGFEDRESPRELELVLSALGAEEAYAQRYQSLTEDGFAAFLVVDRENPLSVISCLTLARDNARGVRESISTEMWEELNRTYLSMHRVTAAYLLINGLHDFCRQVRLGSQLFQGVTDATMAHDEAWHFLQVGKFLERAGMTARILLARGSELLLDSGHIEAEEVHRWLSLLRSVSAYEAYMRLRAGGVQPAAVAEFLLLDQTFPRSVAFGARRVHEELEAIDREHGVRRPDGPVVSAGALAARLRYTTPGEFAAGGLMTLLGDIEQRCNAIGAGVRRAYFDATPASAAAGD